MTAEDDWFAEAWELLSALTPEELRATFTAEHLEELYHRITVALDSMDPTVTNPN